jgi:hypothetical protein
MVSKTTDILELSFFGNDLGRKSIPIYDLGETLIALQRIVNKTFLVQNNCWMKNARLSINDPNLALQIVEHQYGSDIYRFSWFTDVLRQFPSELSTKILLEGIQWVSIYARQNVSEQIKSLINTKLESSEKTINGIMAIYPELISLTNRIDSLGKIVEIRIDLKGQWEPITLTRHTKKYVRHLEFL